MTCNVENVKTRVKMPADQEILRTTKLQTHSQKKQSSALAESIQPSVVHPKRIPKQKMAPTANKSQVSYHVSYES